MTMITRFAPFHELAAFQNHVNNWLGGRTETGSSKDSLSASSSFLPAVDIYEDEHKLVLKLEIPGVSEEDLDVQLENNTLTVKGERKFEKEEKEENFHRVERRFGTFARTFRLPNTVDGENVSADYTQGVLKVTLVKREEAKPKQIKIGAGEKTLQG